MEQGKEGFRSCRIPCFTRGYGSLSLRGSTRPDRDLRTGGMKKKRPTRRQRKHWPASNASYQDKDGLDTDAFHTKEGRSVDLPLACVTRRQRRQISPSGRQTRSLNIWGGHHAAQTAVTTILQDVVYPLVPPPRLRPAGKRLGTPSIVESLLPLNYRSSAPGVSCRGTIRHRRGIARDAAAPKPFAWLRCMARA